MTPTGQKKLGPLLVFNDNHRLKRTFTACFQKWLILMLNPPLWKNTYFFLWISDICGKGANQFLEHHWGQAERLLWAIGNQINMSPTCLRSTTCDIWNYLFTHWLIPYMVQNDVHVISDTRHSHIESLCQQSYRAASSLICLCLDSGISLVSVGVAEVPCVCPKLWHRSSFSLWGRMSDFSMPRTEFKFCESNAAVYNDLRALKYVYIYTFYIVYMIRM